MNKRYGLYYIEEADRRFPAGYLFIWILFPQEVQVQRFVATYDRQMDAAIRRWFQTFGHGMTAAPFDAIIQEQRRRMQATRPVAIPQYAESRRTRRYAA